MNPGNFSPATSSNFSRLLAAIALLALQIGVPVVIHAEDSFRAARSLAFRAAVLWRADKTENPLQSFPPSQELLAILARATAPAQDALIKKPFTECLRVEATVDGVQRILILPLPLPDGSGPYAFFAHPGTKGEIPQLVLNAEDAKNLGLLLRNFK